MNEILLSVLPYEGNPEKITVDDLTAWVDRYYSSYSDIAGRLIDDQPGIFGRSGRALASMISVDLVFFVKALAAAIKTQRATMERRGIDPETIDFELHQFETAVRCLAARMTAGGGAA